MKTLGKPKKINHEYKKQKKILKLQLRKKPLEKNLKILEKEKEKFHYTPSAWNTSWKESIHMKGLKEGIHNLKQQINTLDVEITKVR